MFSEYKSVIFEGKEICDITTRFVFDRLMLNSGVCQSYLIEHWISIDSLAYKLYGATKYYWVLMLSNNIIDPFLDWMLSPEELDNYIARKYIDPYAVHHYEYTEPFGHSSNFQTIIIWPQDWHGQYPKENVKTVTNSEFEYDCNEKKRKIRIVKPDNLQYVIDNLRKAGVY